MGAVRPSFLSSSDAIPPIFAACRRRTIHEKTHHPPDRAERRRRRTLRSHHDPDRLVRLRKYPVPHRG